MPAISRLQRVQIREVCRSQPDGGFYQALDPFVRMLEGEDG